MTGLTIVVKLKGMRLSHRFSNLAAPVCLFGFWLLLRFVLIMKIRGLIFQNFDAGNGERVLINHGLIVIEATLMFLLFAIFRKNRRIDEFYFLGNPKNSILYGLIFGLLIFAVTIPVALYFGMKYSPQFAAVEAIGNIFSNAAEEIIYRGILFSAAVLVFRRSWLGVVVSSIAFGIGHWDLPILLQTYIVAVGLVLGWTYLRTRSLTAPYLAHTVADLLTDSFFH